MKAKRTTFEVDGIKEPCIEVGEESCKVRISKFYHYIGKDTLLVAVFADGELNSKEEVKGDYDSLTFADAIRIAKETSAYVH